MDPLVGFQIAPESRLGDGVAWPPAKPANGATQRGSVGPTARGLRARGLRAPCWKERAQDSVEDKKRRIAGPDVRADRCVEPAVQERASGPSDAVAYEDMRVVGVGHAEETEEFAWGAVNNIPLPIDLVTKAGAEAMSHLEGKLFEVVKKSEAWAATWRSPIGTDVVDMGITHCTRLRRCGRDGRRGTSRARATRAGRTCSAPLRRSSS